MRDDVHIGKPVQRTGRRRCVLAIELVVNGLFIWGLYSLAISPLGPRMERDVAWSLIMILGGVCIVQLVALISTFNAKER